MINEKDIYIYILIKKKEMEKKILFQKILFE